MSIEIDKLLEYLKTKNDNQLLVYFYICYLDSCEFINFVGLQKEYVAWGVDKEKYQRDYNLKKNDIFLEYLQKKRNKGVDN